MDADDNAPTVDADADAGTGAGTATDGPGRHATVAVVLAAGGGSRFVGATHKLLATIGDRTVVERAVAAAVEARIGPVIVIAGACELPRTVGDRAEVSIVPNPRWAEGQATSLGIAVAAAEQAGADTIVVGLGDQPFVEPEAWRRVAGSSSPIAVATYDGLARNPVRLHRSVWSLLPLEGDEGARSVVRMRPDLVEQVPCPGSPADIDTADDLDRLAHGPTVGPAHSDNAEERRSWQSRSSTNSP